MAAQIIVSRLNGAAFQNHDVIRQQGHRPGGISGGQRCLKLVHRGNGVCGICARGLCADWRQCHAHCECKSGGAPSGTHGMPQGSNFDEETVLCALKCGCRETEVQRFRNL